MNKEWVEGVPCPKLQTLYASSVHRPVPLPAISMRSMVALLLVLLVAEAVPVLGIPGLSAPPPVWPVAYELVYNFRMPYLDSIQAAGDKAAAHSADL